MRQKPGGSPRSEVAPARGARLRPMLVAALLGVAAAAGQAPLGAWWAALAGHAGAIWLIAGQARPAPAALLGWAFGAGHFAAALSWLVEPFLVEPDVHGWMAPFALAFMAGGLALFWAGAAAGAVLLGGRSVRARALALALALAAAELVRGVVLTGFPWAQPGHIWAETPLLQAAAVVGATGLTALTLLAAALPRVLAGALPGGAGAGAVLGAALAAAGLGAVALWGGARLAAPLPPPAAEVTVRIVQPNAAQHLKWQPDMARLFFERHLALTAAPPAAPGGRAPDLVLWSETAVPFALDGRAEVAGALARMARAAGGAPLVFGVQRAEGEAWFNALALLDPAGEVAAVYDKHHLVPFGEYIPFGEALSALGIRGFAVREGYGFAPGPGPRILDLGAAGRALPLICYEAVFPASIRGAPERPDWLFQATNDGWFGEVSGPYQHLAQARFRAVEFGLPLLRAANTGISAAIDAHGRVLAALPLGVEGLLDVALPAALPPTPYARAGEAPLLALLGLLALGILARRWRNPA